MGVKISHSRKRIENNSVSIIINPLENNTSRQNDESKNLNQIIHEKIEIKEDFNRKKKEKKEINNLPLDSEITKKINYVFPLEEEKKSVSKIKLVK